MKARALYYSLVLQTLNTAYLAVFPKSEAKHSGFYIFMAILGAAAFYRIRPGNIQTWINKWSAKDQFPLKKGSPKTLRIIFTLSFILGVYEIASKPGSIEINSVMMLILSTPFLFFIFDEELTNFIWANSKTAEKSSFSVLKILLIFVGSVVLFSFGFKAYRHWLNDKRVQKINECLESGGCMDPDTLICGSYVKDPTKMCGVPQQGP